jgi:hypothetical protein
MKKPTTNRLFNRLPSRLRLSIHLFDPELVFATDKELAAWILSPALDKQPNVGKVTATEARLMAVQVT